MKKEEGVRGRHGGIHRRRKKGSEADMAVFIYTLIYTHIAHTRIHTYKHTAIPGE